MSSINHELFVTITKYCRPSDLKQIAILSKECNDIVQPTVDYIFDLDKELPDWITKYIRSYIKPIESRLIEKKKGNVYIFYHTNRSNDKDIKDMQNNYASSVIALKKEFIKDSNIFLAGE